MIVTDDIHDIVVKFIQSFGMLRNQIDVADIEDLIRRLPSETANGTTPGNTNRPETC
jgi:hypothetical protein